MKLRIGAALLCALPLLLSFPVAAVTTAPAESPLGAAVMIATEAAEVDEKLYYYDGDRKCDPEEFEWVSGHNGKAVKLGGDRYLRYSSTRVRELTEFTFAAWVKWQGGADNQRLLTVYKDDTCQLTVSVNAVDAVAHLNGLCMSWIGNQTDPILLYKPVNEGVTTELAKGVWHHLTVVASDTEYTLYINGTPYLTHAMDTSFVDMGLNTFLIGGSVGDEPRLNALLDDAVLYKQALTAQQVALLAAGLDPADGGTAPTVTEHHATAPPRITTAASAAAAGTSDFPYALILIPALVIAAVVVLSLVFSRRYPDPATRSVGAETDDEPDMHIVVGNPPVTITADDEEDDQ